LLDFILHFKEYLNILEVKLKFQIITTTKFQRFYTYNLNVFIVDTLV